MFADVLPCIVGEDHEDNGDYTADLQVGEGDVPRPEEERETLAAKNARLQKQLEVSVWWQSSVLVWWWSCVLLHYWDSAAGLLLLLDMQKWFMCIAMVYAV